MISWKLVYDASGTEEGRLILILAMIALAVSVGITYFQLQPAGHRAERDWSKVSRGVASQKKDK